MALSENKIIIPHKASLEGDPGDVSTHRLSLLPYFLDIEGITDPSSWDWSVEIGKLFPERVEKNFFGLITKVIPAHYGLTQQDVSSSNHIYHPSGGVTLTGSGYPEFIINFGKLVPGEEYPINLIIKGKKLVGGNPIQKNFYEKLTFMMEKQKVTSSSGFISYVNPHAGAAAAATNQTGDILMVKDGVLTSVEVVGSKEENPNTIGAASLTDVGLETLIRLNPNLSKTLVDTNQYGNDLDHRYYYTRKEKDQYYNALIDRVYLFKKNEFDAENNIDTTLKLDLRDYWANGGYLKYNHETFSNAGNVVDFRLMAFDRTREDQAWRLPVQLRNAEGRTATEEVYVSKILWEERGAGASAVSRNKQLMKDLSLDQALSFATIGAWAYQEMTIQKAYPHSTAYLAERLSNFQTGQGPASQAISINQDRVFDNTKGGRGAWLINVISSPTSMEVPGDAVLASVGEEIVIELGSLSGLMEKMNGKDYNAFLDMCLRSLEWRKQTSITYKLSTTQDTGTKTYVMGQDGLSPNWNLGPGIREQVLEKLITRRGGATIDSRLPGYDATGLKVTETKVRSQAQTSIDEYNYAYINAAPFIKDSIPFLSNRGFSLDELGFSLDTDDGDLHGFYYAMTLEVPQNKDTVRADLELVGLDGSLLEERGGNLYYDAVINHGLKVTFGIGYGEESIVGEKTQEQHKAQIRIQMPTTFFGLEYLKTQRDGGTIDQVRAMFEKKVSDRFHMSADLLYLDANTKVLQGGGGDIQGFIGGTWSF